MRVEHFRPVEPSRCPRNAWRLGSLLVRLPLHLPVMLRLPGAETAHVPESKILDYLLSPDHPVGKDKAAYFTSRGFRRENPQLLRRALLELARRGTVVDVTETGWGTKYYVEGSVRAPDGNRLDLATVWMGTDRGGPRLVTAYPRPERTR